MVRKSVKDYTPLAIFTLHNDCVCITACCAHDDKLWLTGIWSNSSSTVVATTTGSTQRDKLNGCLIKEGRPLNQVWHSHMATVANCLWSWSPPHPGHHHSGVHCWVQLNGAGEGEGSASIENTSAVGCDGDSWLWNCKENRSINLNVHKMTLISHTHFALKCLYWP